MVEWHAIAAQRRVRLSSGNVGQWLAPVVNVGLDTS